MKKELLQKLQCLNCNSRKLEIKKTKSNAREIISGTITCKKCGQEYYIKKGIVDFLLNQNKSIENEQKGWQAFSKNKKENAEFVKQLPFPTRLQEKEQAHWQQQATNFFQALELLQLKGNEEVLDIGAGRCWSTREIAKRSKNTTAADIVEKKFFGLECADLFLSKKLFFERVLADMHALPFANESFDVVFCTASFHHSSNLKQAFRETARVLKKNGKIVLTNEPVRGLLDNKEINLEEKNLGINETKPSFFEWHNAIKKAGLQPKYFFPKSIEQMLESKKVYADKKHKLLLGKIAAKAAHFQTIKKILLKANLPLQIVLGATLVCIATKK